MIPLWWLVVMGVVWLAWRFFRAAMNAPSPSEDGLSGEKGGNHPVSDGYRYGHSHGHGVVNVGWRKN